LLTQEIRRERSLALLKAGNNIAARIAMMAMTTSSSISVKPRRHERAEALVLDDRSSARISIGSHCMVRSQSGGLL
jgi:hypothetical protein